MHYIGQSAGSMLAPKILGTYECELSRVIQTICIRNPKLVIDVGAAEGYYAVGFAWRVEGCRTIAFEAEPEAQRLCEELARLNGVANRVQIEGRCEVDGLRQMLDRHQLPDLLIVDIEGGERDLLSPALIPALEHCPILVELHPWLAPDIGTILQKRFASTHEIKVIRTAERKVSNLPISRFHQWLFGRWFLSLVHEGRPEAMEWLYLTPHH